METKVWGKKKVNKYRETKVLEGTNENKSFGKKDVGEEMERQIQGKKSRKNVGEKAGKKNHSP